MRINPSSTKLAPIWARLWVWVVLLSGVIVPLRAQTAEAVPREDYQALQARALAEGRWEDRLLLMRDEALSLASSEQWAQAQKTIAEAITLAQELVATDLMPTLWETAALCHWASGETAQALMFMERAGTLALETQPVQWELAERAWAQLAEWQRSLGQPEVAAQIDAWRQRVSFRDESVTPYSDLQPRVTKLVVPCGEAAHARLTLNNHRLYRVTGRLWIEAEEIQFTSWRATADGCAVQGRFSRDLKHPVHEVRQLTLRPREQKSVEIVIECLGRAQEQSVQLTVCWEVGGVIQRSTVGVLFSPHLPIKQATHSSLSELNPYRALPVYEEIQHQEVARERLENFRVTTNQPSRVEVYELHRQGATIERWPLAIDAEGDGRYDGWGDTLFVDEDRNGYPEVMLAPDQSRASLEFLLYPKQPTTHDIDVEMHLQENLQAWRPVPDAVHRLQAKPIVKP